MSEKPQLGGVSTTGIPAASGRCGIVPVEASQRALLTESPSPLPADSFTSRRLITVSEAAFLLHVSESWVRRHLSELPTIRCGRLLRIDADALRSKIEDGKSLKSERVNMTPRRYQRGSVFWKKGKRGKEEVAYGVYRVDVQTASGVKRRQKKVRLGTRKELVTESNARTKLNDKFIAAGECAPPVPEKMTFGKLAEKWRAAEGPSLTEPTLDRYVAVLRAWLLPFWKDRSIQSITRDEIQLFLNSRAGAYSKSSIRSMRLVLQMTLSYAHLSGWISTYPCVKIKTPRVTNQSGTVKRAQMTEGQRLNISARVAEPYSTLVLLMARIPLRIEEAIGLKETDLDGHVLTLRRVVYEGKVYDLERDEQRQIPVMDVELLARLKKLAAGREWVFQSRNGTPLNPNNIRRRFLKPAAKELGVALCGWHDFRHSLTTELRRNGTHPKVISDLLGHKKVNLAMDVYDRSNLQDFEQALRSTVAGSQLLPSCDPKVSVQ
jgi:integrase